MGKIDHLISRKILVSFFVFSFIGFALFAGFVLDWSRAYADEICPMTGACQDSYEPCFYGGLPSESGTQCCTALAVDYTISFCGGSGCLADSGEWCIGTITTIVWQEYWATCTRDCYGGQDWEGVPCWYCGNWDVGACEPSDLTTSTTCDPIGCSADADCGPPPCGECDELWTKCVAVPGCWGNPSSSYSCSGTSCVEDPEGSYGSSDCSNECGAGAPGGNPHFDVAITQKPSVSIEQGQTATFDLTITPYDYYTGNVNLSVSGCPSGASCTFLTSPVVITDGVTTGTSALLVQNTGSVAPATYPLTVTGTDTAPDPDLTDSDSSDLIVATPPPSCVQPTDLLPTGSVVPTSGKVTLSWDAVLDATSYNVRLDDGIDDQEWDDPRFLGKCNPAPPDIHYYCENTINAATYCSAGTCSLSNIPVVIGRTYTYWLHPRYSPGRDDCAGGTNFTVVPPNQPPTVPSITVTEPDYCNGVGATVNWTYSDPDSDPQSAYQVQIDNTGSAWNPPFTVDTGKVSGSGTAYFASGLAFNITYKARVKVWDSHDNVSSWKEQTACVGSGCLGGGKSWKTPKHAYPLVDFNWLPSSPAASQPVQFTDQTTFYDGGGTRTWSWLFGDSGTSTQQSPPHTYNLPGLYNASLTAADKDNYSCPRTKQINIGQAVPVWKEVSPR